MRLGKCPVRRHLLAIFVCAIDHLRSRITLRADRCVSDAARLVVLMMQQIENGETSMNRMRQLLILIALLLLGPTSGCVTTASMYLEKDLYPMDDVQYTPELARHESDMKARIQIDMKKQWQ